MGTSREALGVSWGSGSDSRGVQIAQVGPKLIPESVQVGSKSVQVGSKSVQVGSKSVQVHPRFFQDGPKGEPRWRQDDPRLCQDGPSDRPPARPIARPSDRPTEFIYTNSRSTASAAPYYRLSIVYYLLSIIMHEYTYINLDTDVHIYIYILDTRYYILYMV